MVAWILAVAVAAAVAVGSLMLPPSPLIATSAPDAKSNAKTETATTNINIIKWKHRVGTVDFALATTFALFSVALSQLQLFFLAAGNILVDNFVQTGFILDRL